MTQIENGTWVLIADGEKALFLRNITDAEDPNLEVVREEHQDNPPNRDQATSRPGRLSDGPGAHRSALDETDWHKLEKGRFAHDLADLLYRQSHRGRFERIVLVAAPEILGALRQHLHREVAEKVVGEIAKTLTNHPLDKIERLVSAA